MATSSVNYSSASAITIGLASLASSSTWLAGRESNEVDNSTNKYDDVFIQGKVRVGTTPTINTLILVFAWGSDVSAATTALDVIDGGARRAPATRTGQALGSLQDMKR